ncbi:MAG: B12-binding domain-containing radical SAM protein [Clostridia bacterium]|nr:B12-binding domain-containing radical SAM protein [Clostridia bacterium]
MKTLIVALNSKYIHSSLAPWYLKASCGEEPGEITIKEFTINDSIDSILSDIYRGKADLVAFSCYIWNIDIVLKIAENLKKICPGIKVALGGPEVSFDSVQILERYTFIDYVIIGEGESVFKHLLIAEKFDKRDGLYGIKGLTARINGKVYSNTEYQMINDLDSIPSPYTSEMIFSLNKRIVYYESSRGCPFSCTYCLSSTFDGVRYFSMDRVEEDLNRLIEAGVAQIKFVDRTFNCNRNRAKQIFKFIIQKSRSGIKTNFHFEVAADLFDDEMIEILKNAPEGLIQFEIGVQTTNEETFEVINRKTNLVKLFENTNRLKMLGNIHIHMDLIAGLPGEGMNSFKNSFNEAYSIKPHQLQLGFLKLLKGSSIRERAGEYDYIFKEYAPYEILSNKYIGFNEILSLKELEEMVERYYNSGRFIHILEYIMNRLFMSAFEFYEHLSAYYRTKGFMNKPPSSRTLYSILYDFLKDIAPDRKGFINEILKLDFLSSDNSNNLPEGIEREVMQGFKEWCFDFLKSEQNISLYLPDFKGVPPKQIYKSVHFEIFSKDVLSELGISDLNRGKYVVLFNYSRRSRVTGLYEFKPIMESYL